MIVVEHRVGGDDARHAAELLAARSGLSRRAVKEAMAKGAVWLRRGGSRRRLRRATKPLRVGDRVELYYDERVLKAEPPAARCLLERERFSVWLKPAGLLSQGTDYGDHCSLLRQVELHRRGRGAHLVHRLDRETAGLVVLAHDSQAAAALSALFRTGAVAKRYHAVVLGDAAARLGEEGTLASDVGGKAARTAFRVLAVRSESGRAVSDVELLLGTGRTHQIRRQLAEAGLPVLGDPRYGRGNKNREGLQLTAHGLELVCPFTGEALKVELPETASGVSPRATPDVGLDSPA